MSFFGFFGSFCDRYSQREHPLSELEARRLISEINIKTLEKREELAIEDAILARRRGDGKISLRQICETLFHLERQRLISVYDRKGAMKLFEEYFRRFGN